MNRDQAIAAAEQLGIVKIKGERGGRLAQADTDVIEAALHGERDVITAPLPSTFNIEGDDESPQLLHEHTCRDCDEGFLCDGDELYGGCASFTGSCPDCERAASTTMLPCVVCEPWLQPERPAASQSHHRPPAGRAAQRRDRATAAAVLRRPREP